MMDGYFTFCLIEKLAPSIESGHLLPPPLSLLWPLLYGNTNHGRFDTNYIIFRKMLKFFQKKKFIKKKKNCDMKITNSFRNFRIFYIFQYEIFKIKQVNQLTLKYWTTYFRQTLSMERICLVRAQVWTIVRASPFDDLDYESKCWARFDFRFNRLTSHMGACKWGFEVRDRAEAIGTLSLQTRHK